MSNLVSYIVDMEAVPEIKQRVIGPVSIVMRNLMIVWNRP